MELTLQGAMQIIEHEIIVLQTKIDYRDLYLLQSAYEHVENELVEKGLIDHVE